MNATVLDFRTNMKEIFAAIDRHESVSVTYRGKKRAVLVPCEAPAPVKSVTEHPAFGMWADREDMSDVIGHVKKMRAGRVF